MGPNKNKDDKGKEEEEEEEEEEDDDDDEDHEGYLSIETKLYSYQRVERLFVFVLCSNRE